jgi:hypothetical protein
VKRARYISAVFTIGYVADRLGDRFFGMVECLVGKALIPEDMRQKGVTTHGQVETRTNGSGAVALAIVKGRAFFQMSACVQRERPNGNGLRPTSW